MADFARELAIMIDLVRAKRGGPRALARRRDARLAALVAHARTSSPFYRELYRGLPESVLLRELPPVTKPELMAHFDDWVTDPAVTRADLEAFVADRSLVGSRYRGRYFVCTSSGTTGHPGLFVHDPGAVATYRAQAVRAFGAALDAGRLPAMLRRRGRTAVVVGTGGHFAGVVWLESERRRSRGRRRAYRLISVQQPLPRLVQELNDFDPALLIGYPSALELLAAEQDAGRLHIRPVVVESSGESLGDRARLAAALGAEVHNVYAASEFSPIALDCPRGWLHVNSDWVILEPVEEDYRPTPAGQPSHTVLLTNLANRVQPLIRYDLGDSVIAKPGPCECGNPLPAIRVAGRHDDVLHLQKAGGGTVSVLPLAITAPIDDAPGVHRCQLVQSGPAELRVRLQLEPGAAGETVWQDVTAKLAGFLAGQGLANVDLVRAEEAPDQTGASGKFHQVIALKPPPGSV
ncbi:phenylacetate--CoA ligase family protein [Arthrobacter sp. C9C5]|uniref:phenylacetate--CoA ligase family protein n=1 Tax=Arthrobacter sp. C9C5 TaxID=2735267 RepID=UPI0015853068|nr:phenylacetate--CoA ligase family protein [Arthrobacter sp. C9C5]NUU32327.1 phenylacetate--CoA ligase family protein [Arthrobacter sp. C9C5]